MSIIAGFLALKGVAAIAGAVKAVANAGKAGVEYLKGSRLKKAGADEAKVESLEENHERTKRANRAASGVGDDSDRLREPDPDSRD